MTTRSILMIGIALAAASCATMASKPVQPPASPGLGDPTPVGIGSSQQGPCLNGDVTDDACAVPADDRTTGVTADGVTVVGGQLFWGAPR